jgi:hypothetical protein
MTRAGIEYEEVLMVDDKKAPAEKEDKVEEIKAPVAEICDNAAASAAAEIDDDSEIKPVEGFFLTSQRWH